MRVLILGASGMLGNAMFRLLSQDKQLSVLATARGENAKRYFSDELAKQILVGVDVEQHDSLVETFIKAKPDVVINCIGVVKQLKAAKEPLQAIPINALLPHRLAALCELQGARLIHISTDCVFSGDKGNYTEADFADADDIYGRSKYLGEVDYPNAITLRTSIIGHERQGNRSLINWFLSQEGVVNGFTHAIYSGVPTIELANIIHDVILPRPALHGVYHVASKPINKYDLLELVKEAYGKQIEIKPSSELKIDRSLNADRFKAATGYVAPEWPELVRRMCEFK